MKQLAIWTIGPAMILTFASLAVWQGTGGDYYTKYEVVEQVETEVDQNDPLAQAGFYEGETQTETVTRDEFRLGLLPTPNNLFDKHLLSVASLNTLFWGAAIVVLFIGWRRQKKQAEAGNTAASELSSQTA